MNENRNLLSPQMSVLESERPGTLASSTNSSGDIQLDLVNRRVDMLGIKPELVRAVGDLREISTEDRLLINASIQRAETTINKSLENALVSTVLTGMKFTNENTADVKPSIDDSLHVTGLTIPYCAISKAMQRNIPPGADWIEDQDYSFDVYFEIEARVNNKRTSRIVRKQSGGTVKLYNDGSQPANFENGKSVISDRGKKLAGISNGEFYKYTHTSRSDPLGSYSLPPGLDSGSDRDPGDKRSDIPRQYYINDTDRTFGLQTMDLITGHNDKDQTYHLMDAVAVLVPHPKKKEASLTFGLSESDLNVAVQGALTAATAELGPAGQAAVALIGGLLKSEIDKKLEADKSSRHKPISIHLTERGIGGAEVNSKDTLIPRHNGVPRSKFLSKFGEAPELWVYGVARKAEKLKVRPPPTLIDLLEGTLRIDYADLKDKMSKKGKLSKKDFMSNPFLDFFTSGKPPKSIAMKTDFYLSPSVRIRVSRQVGTRSISNSVIQGEAF